MRRMKSKSKLHIRYPCQMIKYVMGGCVLSSMISNLNEKEFKDKIDTGIEIYGQKIAMLITSRF